MYKGFRTFAFTVICILPATTLCVKNNLIRAIALNFNKALLNAPLPQKATCNSVSALLSYVYTHYKPYTQQNSGNKKQLLLINPYTHQPIIKQQLIPLKNSNSVILYSMFGKDVLEKMNDDLRLKQSMDDNKAQTLKLHKADSTVRYVTHLERCLKKNMLDQKELDAYTTAQKITYKWCYGYNCVTELPVEALMKLEEQGTRASLLNNGNYYIR